MDPAHGRVPVPRAAAGRTVIPPRGTAVPGGGTPAGPAAPRGRAPAPPRTGAPGVPQAWPTAGTPQARPAPGVQDWRRGRPASQPARPPAGYRDRPRQPPAARGGLGGPGRGGRPRPRRRGFQVLLLLPIVLPLLTPVYNRLEPRVWGIPFFYWYQVGCAFVAMLTIALVHQATKRRK
jgi:hypothetical protein